MLPWGVVVWVDELQLWLTINFPFVLVLCRQWTVANVYIGLTKPNEALIVTAQKAVIPAFLKAMGPVAVVVVHIVYWVLIVVEVPLVWRLPIAFVTSIMGNWTTDFHVDVPLVLSLRPCGLWYIFTPTGGLPRYLLLLRHGWLHWHVEFWRVGILEDWNISRYVSRSIERIYMANKFGLACASLVLIVGLIWAQRPRINLLLTAIFVEFI